MIGMLHHVGIYYAAFFKDTDRMTVEITAD